MTARQKQRFPNAIVDYENLIKDMLKAQGVPAVGAKIIAVSFSEPEDQSLEQLSERTGYSLATVSNKIRMLEMMGSVERVKKAGSRKVFVKPKRDVIDDLHHKILQAQRTQITTAKEQLPRLIRDLELDITRTKDKNTRKHYTQHLDVMKNHLEQTRILEDIFSELMTIIRRKREDRIKR
ncbi:MAG: hypothetical protein ACOCZV_01420 [Nanoarchaeota archaeon]